MSVPGETSLSTSLRLWQRFHVRLTALHAAILFLVITLMASVFYSRMVGSEMSGLRDRLRATAVSLAEGIPPDLARGLCAPTALASSPAHLTLLDVSERVAASIPDLVSIYLLRLDPEPGWLVYCADYMPEDVPAVPGERYQVPPGIRMLDAFAGPQVDEEVVADRWGATLSAYAPVHDEAGRPLAVLGVEVAQAGVSAIRREVLLLTLLAFAAAAAVLAGTSSIIGRNVRRPLGRIIETTDAISGGQFASRIQFERQDEFGILGRNIDRMATGLAEREFIRETFGRYVSPEVARQVLGDRDRGPRLGGEEREVTVLFNDVRGYSTISERLEPAQVIDFMNTYFTAMGEVIDVHHGCVLEFLGDAILAVFGAPNALPDHAERAVSCALAMRARVALLNQEFQAAGTSRLWEAAGMKELWCRSGIHTGVVVAGNLGGRTRVKYGIIGDALNLAMQVESLNKELGTDVLITEEAWRRLPEALVQRATNRGRHAVSGRKQDVAVYSF